MNELDPWSAQHETDRLLAVGDERAVANQRQHVRDLEEVERRERRHHEYARRKLRRTFRLNLTAIWVIERLTGLTLRDLERVFEQHLIRVGNSLLAVHKREDEYQRIQGEHGNMPH